MTNWATNKNKHYDQQTELRVELEKVLPDLWWEVSISLTDTLSDVHNPYLFDADFWNEPAVVELMDKLILAIKDKNKQLIRDLIKEISDLYYEPNRIIKRIFHNQAIFNHYYQERDWENTFYTWEGLIRLNKSYYKLYPNDPQTFDQKFIDLWVFINPQLYTSMTNPSWTTWYKLNFTKIADITWFTIPEKS